MPITKKIAAALLALLAAWYYATPYLALNAIGHAAEAKDAGALSERIDFPAVRDSLKAGYRAEAAARLGADGTPDPLGALGLALVGGIVDVAVDALVTPEGIALLLQGNLPHRNEEAAEKSQPPSSGGGDAGPERQVSQGYAGWNRFEVRVRRGERTTLFTLVRHGIADWKLAAIALPPSR